MAENKYLNVYSGVTVAKGVGKEATNVGRFAVTFLPAVMGGLFAKQVYTWGIRVFKKEKGTWVITKTDEGAGSIMVLIFAFLVWRLVDWEMTEMFIAGLLGRSSYVLRNTLYRLFGKEPPANLPPIEIRAANQAATGRKLLEEGGGAVDDETIKEIGLYGLQNDDFRDRVSSGLARRVNDWLDSQGRPPVDDAAVQGAIKEVFQGMAGRTRAS